MKYVCKRCNYESDRLANLKAHLSRKKYCEDTLMCNISTEDLLKAFDKDESNFKYECKICHAKYETNSGKNKHQAKCKLKAEILHIKELQISKRTIDNLQDEIKELKTIIIRIEENQNIIQQQNNNNIQQNNIENNIQQQNNIENNNIQQQNNIENNNIQQQNNIENKIENNNIENKIHQTNITINAIGSENLSHISTDFTIKCLNNKVDGLISLIKKWHFDKDHPENRNILPLNDTHYQILETPIRCNSIRNVERISSYNNNYWIKQEKSETINEHMFTRMVPFINDFMVRYPEEAKKLNIANFNDSIARPLKWETVLNEDDDFDCFDTPEEEDEKRNIENQIINGIDEAMIQLSPPVSAV